MKDAEMYEVMRIIELVVILSQSVFEIFKFCSQKGFFMLNFDPLGYKLSCYGKAKFLE